MDEILIEEKKYVSSKQAAKMTGYAKDYIGQLCREGRVPARLVGRSWYVLETAIQDHRFGTSDETMQSAPVLQPSWESPRYEASSDELLPSINRLREEREVATNDKAPEHLQDSWRAWFDRVADTEVVAPVIEKTEVIEDVKEEEKEEEGEVNVPIRAVYRQPPEELLPRRRPETRPPSEPVEQITRQERQKVNNTVMMIRAIRVSGILLATIIAAVAVIGSGYLDEYIISNSQVRIIAGIGLYNK